MDTPHWEYRDFIYIPWRPQDIWTCVTYKDQYWTDEARQFFWEIGKEKIVTELQIWLDQGWESLTEIGPDAINVSQAQQRANPIQTSDVFLWLVTLGLAFILQFWLNAPRRITVYTPVEFRLHMRHLTPQKVSVTS